MITLDYFPHQKSVQYNTIIEDEIYFSDSMSSVIRKIGTPENTEEYDNQTTLEYKRKLHTLISSAYYCFNQSKLCSVCYESDALTKDESKCFVSKIEKVISESIFDSGISYTCCGKEYWELSDGAVSMHISLYIENSIARIKINYFD